jgi:hypothetical protein
MLPNGTVTWPIGERKGNKAENFDLKENIVKKLISDFPRLPGSLYLAALLLPGGLVAVPLLWLLGRRRHGSRSARS